MSAVYVISDELWRECASWLTQWNVLRSDHRANWPSAGIVDLAYTLRDGVLLCTLLSKMDPGCIDMKDVNLKPAMARNLCLRNINIFILTCTNIFGLTESELFEPLMLFDFTNFHKVLCTISHLSLSLKSTQSDIPGFSIESVRSQEEEDIYESLKSVEPPSRISQNAVEFEEHGEYNRGEEIYQDLCSVQSSLSEFVGTHTPIEERHNVINELVVTERKYVGVISKLQNKFMRPLQRYLTPEIHAGIFCNINELHEIHTAFLSQLRKVEKDKSVKISNIFMTVREKFLVYGVYCSNLFNVDALLQEHCGNDELLHQAIIKCEQEDSNGQRKLRDILFAPMQRILKYRLLLDRLIELTEPNHEEYQDLKRAKDVMVDVAEYINKSTGDSQHLAVIKNVHENIIDWDDSFESKLEICGRLIKYGELKIKDRHSQKIRNRHVFIFDKVMILCKRLKGGQFAYRDLLHLREYTINKCNNRLLLNMESGWFYQWRLMNHDDSIAYNLYAKSIQIKNKMMEALNDAVDNICPASLSQTNHRFEMETFNKPTTCNRCSKYLKGIIYQGYRCKICDIAVHKKCIATSGRCDVPHDLLLNDKLWFVGEMCRKKAYAVLENRLHGTYLVRSRSEKEDPHPYVLSLKTGNTVKHMKIRCDIVGSENKYLLSHVKCFNSVQELIETYQNCSLNENFETLDAHAVLKWPYRQFRAVATRNFEPKDSEQQIPLRKGQEVIITGQEGYRDGWWRGEYDNQVGYFPDTYVRILGTIPLEGC